MGMRQPLLRALMVAACLALLSLLSLPAVSAAGGMGCLLVNERDSTLCEACDTEWEWTLDTATHQCVGGIDPNDAAARRLSATSTAAVAVFAATSLIAALY